MLQAEEGQGLIHSCRGSLRKEKRRGGGRARAGIKREEDEGKRLEKRGVGKGMRVNKDKGKKTARKIRGQEKGEGV